MTVKRNRRFKRSIRSFLIVSALALTGIVSAQAAAPDVTVRETTNEVLTVIAGEPDAQRLQQLAESKIAPHFDFSRLTQLAAGRVWHQATPEQQQQMSAEFRRLLIRTYTKALATPGASNVKVAVHKVARSSGAGSGDEATVHTKVSQSGRRPIDIDYRMASRDGDWKVIDVIVENVSLVSNYRDWFATQAATGGVDSVIQALQAKNRQGTV